MVRNNLEFKYNEAYFILKNNVCILNDKGSIGKSKCLGSVFGYDTILTVTEKELVCRDITGNPIQVKLVVSMLDLFNYSNLLTEENVVWIIDEDSVENDDYLDNNMLLLKQNEKFKHAITYNLFLIVIGRSGVAARIAGTYEASYLFKVVENGSYLIEPVKYVLPGKQSLNSFDLLITEDSGSGYNYFRELIPNVCVISSYGKSNLFSVALDYIYKYENIGVIFDYTGISCDFIELLELETLENVTLLPISSFEGMLLKSSHLLKSEEVDAKINSNIYNKERAISNMCAKILSSYTINYKKENRNVHRYFLNTMMLLTVIFSVVCIKHFMIIILQKFLNLTTPL